MKIKNTLLAVAAQLLLVGGAYAQNCTPSAGTLTDAAAPFRSTPARRPTSWLRSAIARRRSVLDVTPSTPCRSVPARPATSASPRRSTPTSPCCRVRTGGAILLARSGFDGRWRTGNHLGGRSAGWSVLPADYLVHCGRLRPDQHHRQPDAAGHSAELLGQLSFKAKVPQPVLPRTGFFGRIRVIGRLVLAMCGWLACSGAMAVSIEDGDAGFSYQFRALPSSFVLVNDTDHEIQQLAIKPARPADRIVTSVPEKPPAGTPQSRRRTAHRG